VCRRHRKGTFDTDDLREALRRTAIFAARWTEIDGVIAVRAHAERLLRVHPLRVADALQLGAAVIAVDARPRNRNFVTLDGALFDAAEREGFEAIRPA
jgi:hypothetical protein